MEKRCWPTPCVNTTSLKTAGSPGRHKNNIRITRHRLEQDTKWFLTCTSVLENYYFSYRNKAFLNRKKQALKMLILRISMLLHTQTCMKILNSNTCLFSTLHHLSDSCGLRSRWQLQHLCPSDTNIVSKYLLACFPPAMSSEINTTQFNKVYNNFI